MAPTDESLVAQATKLKDTAAFAELVRRYEQKILLLQRRLTGERSLAEDLAQETFLRAWQKLHTFGGRGSFAGWLASLSYNVFRAHWRKTRRQRNEVPLGDMEFGAREIDQPGLADLDRLLGMLNSEDQVIMTLSYAYGLTNTEVGEVLDMPAGTIKARIHRAKAKIREGLNPTTDRQSPAESEAPAEATAVDGEGAARTRVQPENRVERTRATRPAASIFNTGPATGTLSC